MYQAPYPPYDPTDTAGFSLRSVIDRMHRISHDLCIEMNATDDEAQKEPFKQRIDEAKGIIAQISKLKYEMGRNYIMQHIVGDGDSDIYNEELQRLGEGGKNTWFTSPWLFAEYRLLRSFFTQTTQWTTFDPFLAQKSETFKQSGKAIYQIAATMQELHHEHAKLESDPDKLGVLFKEMIQMCLWLDLSLLTHLSSADIEHLQTVGKDAQSARQEFILRDDQEKVWNHLKSVQSGRVDFVLDNGNCPLRISNFFLTMLQPVFEVCTPHSYSPKDILRCVTPEDFSTTIDCLLDPEFLPPPAGMQSGHLHTMVTRWKKYIDEGIFALSVPFTTALGGGGGAELAEFWTAPSAYWDMRLLAPKLWEALQKSTLVIFKVPLGLLSYRKLTGDVQWPAWTPFSEALGPLAGSFPLLSLRTNKADVVVGVEREVAERLDNSGSKWRVDGRYALISFLEADVE
ncbi:DUF89 domain-containing protein [Mycena rebaudengoi]|nr:DUF89 domain-containing protein [Mycena rebaudengoi]